jgi:hypothetical protein
LPWVFLLRFYYNYLFTNIEKIGIKDKEFISRQINLIYINNKPYYNMIMKPYRKRIKHFDAELFFNQMKGKNIDNNALSKWLDYSHRLLQKWVKENITKNPPRNFIWSFENLIEFQKFYNKEDRKQKNINFITIKDIVNISYEHNRKKLNLNYDDECFYKKNMIKKLRIYLKEKGHKPKSHFGRPYYIITKELKTHLLSSNDWFIKSPIKKIDIIEKTEKTEIKKRIPYNFSRDKEFGLLIGMMKSQQDQEDHDN